ncbi:MAG TPA: hypothetical protein VKK79_21120, partial [Candidatus Lokiarchaeia archaeon]|nr:hypothetical protein [Candidatus Lokiarchaeia archaeon]
MAFDGYFWMMMAVYGGLVIVGYILASRQIKVVKAEEFKLADGAKALFFGVFFGSGSGLIVAMMIAMATYSLAAIGIGQPVPLAEFTQFDLWLILGFITVYPLIDLLYLAYAEKELGQTPYHTMLINKILS